MANLSNTAAKATRAYRVVSAVNPQDRTKTILRPVVVNRETYDTARVLHYAIDNSYVVGGQFYASYGVVNGFLEACQALGKDGRDILLNSWLRIYPVLRGTCDPVTRQIDDENELHVCVQAQADLRRKASDFSWQCVDDSSVRPTVTHLHAEGSETDKVVWPGARIYADGAHLKYTASTDKVTASWTTIDATTLVATEHTVELVPESSGYSYQLLPFPTGLATAAVGTVVTFTFALKQGDAEATCLPATARATLVANPEPPTPALTTVQQGNRAAGTAGFSVAGAQYAITLTGVIPGGFKTTDALKLDSIDADGSVYTTMAATPYVTSSTETTIVLGNGMENDSPKPDGDWEARSAKFTLVRDGAEYPLTFTFSNP